MPAPAVTLAPSAPPSIAATTPKPHPSAFRAVLSELNPLQYIPVIGALYRAVTGDTIPEPTREAGSLVVSFLTGGPIGVATNLALLAGEKITGIDPEKTERAVFASVGIGTHAAPSPSHPAPTPAAPPRTAWSPAQLAAYGVTTTQGTIRHGDVVGSDVLNELELARIDTSKKQEAVLS
jgi:hypothetical protein